MSSVAPVPESSRVDIFPSESPSSFAERAVQILNDGCLALMMSIGHQTGLYDVMAKLPPATSAEIASAAGLNERYVREWLGGMVVSRIVRYDPETRSYFLPPEHASLLTRAAGADNFASFMQYVGLMGQVEEQVVEAFHTGAGVPYSAYPRFQHLQGEESRQMYSTNLVQRIVPLDAELQRRLRDGANVADVGTGSGNAPNLLAQAFPASRFTGFDMSEEGIAAAKAAAAEMRLTNVRFEVRDIATIDEIESYDVVTAFDVIHDLAKPREVLRRISGALKPDGIFLMVDIAAASRLEENLDHPLAPALFTFSTMHCMSVSLAQRGEGLGTVWGKETAIELLAEAGLTNVKLESIEGDILHAIYIARKM